MRGGQGETASKPNKDSDKQGPCPKGYHIPSSYEWQALYNNFKEWKKTETGSNYCSSQASNNSANCILKFR